MPKYIITVETLYSIEAESAAEAEDVFFHDVEGNLLNMIQTRISSVEPDDMERQIR